MATYYLVLKKGKITNRHGIYQGSMHDAVSWAPANPDTQSGWQDGDTLIVLCQFAVNPNVNPQPGANEYVGLCAGACKIGTQEVQILENEAYRIPTPNPGKLLGSGITTNTTPAADNIFYAATPQKVDVTLNNGQTLVQYVHTYSMTYNGANTVVGNGNEVEIVFGYGDPQEADVES